MTRFTLWLLVAVFGILPSGAFAAPAAATFPVLETPAVLSTKSVRSAILSVARAGQRLVAVGERGIILVSDDDGRAWRQIETPVSVGLTAVKFVNDKTGWAVGHFGIVLKSQDGGETWAKQLDGQKVAQIALVAADKMVADGVENADFALREAKYLVSDGPDKPFLDLHFIDENTGFIIGAYNMIFRTDDGGESWAWWYSRIDNPGGMHLYGMRRGGDSIYIAGEQGLILKGDANGERFERLESPYEGSYFGLATNDTADIVVFGLRGNAYRSNDQGQTWTKIDTGRETSISSGVKLSSGAFALVSQTGEVLIESKNSAAFDAMPSGQPIPATSVVEASDGAIIIGTLRGLKRIDVTATR